MSATHARRSRLARFADLFRYDPARPPRPVINVAPGVEIPAHLAPEARETAGRPAMPAWAQRPPWDGETGQMTEPFNPFNPEETGTWGPDGRPDRLLMDEQALTDGRVAPGYIPEAVPYVPDIPADLTELPVFREAVAYRTRDHARACLCGCQMDGDGWGSRMVRAAGHLTGTEVTA